MLIVQVILSNAPLGGSGGLTTIEAAFTHPDDLDAFYDQVEAKDPKRIYYRSASGSFIDTRCVVAVVLLGTDDDGEDDDGGDLDPPEVHSVTAEA